MDVIVELFRLAALLTLAIVASAAGGVVLGALVGALLVLCGVGSIATASLAGGGLGALGGAAFIVWCYRTLNVG